MNANANQTVPEAPAAVSITNSVPLIGICTNMLSIQVLITEVSISLQTACQPPAPGHHPGHAPPWCPAVHQGGRQGAQSPGWRGLAQPHRFGSACPRLVLLASKGQRVKNAGFETDFSPPGRCCGAAFQAGPPRVASAPS